MLLKTDSSPVNASAQKVFEFLSDAKNIEYLLPKDKISDFQSDEKGCSFKAQGGIVIPLIYVSKEPNTKIVMESGENPELARSGKGERSDIRALPSGGKPSP